MCKKNTMSKGREITYNKFETQNYLKRENNVSGEIQRKIMHLRIRDVYVKANYSMAFSDISCSASDLCGFEESQSHVFSCKYLSHENQIVHNDIKFEHIFPIV